MLTGAATAALCLGVVRAEAVEISGSRSGNTITMTLRPGDGEAVVGTLNDLVFPSGNGTVIPGLVDVSTTLSSDITADAGTIPVADASRLPDFGIIRIDEERIAYESKDGNTLNVATGEQGGFAGRGIDGTTPAAHEAGATVGVPTALPDCRMTEALGDAGKSAIFSFVPLGCTPGTPEGCRGVRAIVISILNLNELTSAIDLYTCNVEGEDGLDCPEDDANPFVRAQSSRTPTDEGDDSLPTTCVGPPPGGCDGPCQAAEFQVNTFTIGDQGYPSVCTTPAGETVVVWEGPLVDGDVRGVLARRYGSDGRAVGNEFLVNTYTGDQQQSPGLSCSAEGFVVAWESRSQDGDEYGVFAQRFDAQGSAAGTEFQVNTSTSERQLGVSLCSSPEGGFVVAWQSYDLDGDGSGIFAQRFGADGERQGGEFRVNSYTPRSQGFATTACSPTSFVVAWHSDGQDGNAYGVFAQRFGPEGQLQGTEFQVNTYTLFYQQLPSIAMGETGDFTVVWESYDYQDGDSSGVFGQRFGSEGNKLGQEFQVNTYTVFRQQAPSLAVAEDGDFIVAWSSGQDGDGYGVFGQRFDSTGAPRQGEFQINTYTVADQGAFFALGRVLGVAYSPHGDFTVVWQSTEIGGGQDGYGMGVFGRRFEGQVANGSPTETPAGTVTASTTPTDTPTATPTATQTPVAICGDGTIGPPEQCDDGDTQPGDCCSPGCLFEPASTVCRAATDPCDSAEACTGTSATCPADQRRAEQEACEDGDACTAGETCLAEACIGGEPTTACLSGDGCCASGCRRTVDMDCTRIDYGGQTLAQPPSGPGPVTSGDLDGDGTPELIVGDGISAQVVVLRAGAQARFGAGAGSGVTPAEAVVDLAVADVNGDRKLDVVVAIARQSTDSGDLLVLLGDGALGLAPGIRTGLPGRPVRVQLLELTADGRIDAVIATSQGLEVLRNRNDGSFEGIALLDPERLVADVAVGAALVGGRQGFVAALPGDDEVKVYQYRGDVTGEAAAFAFSEPRAVAPGDFTGDGIEDVAVASADGFVAIVPGRAEEGFGAALAKQAMGVTLERLYRTDLNGDGLADLVGLEQGAAAVQLLFGRGDGTFDLQAGPATSGPAAGLVVADLNGDRVPDLVLSGDDIVIGIADLSGPAVVAGDATGEGIVDAADLNQIVSELFDGDGSDALSCGGGAVVSAAGADASGDRAIGVADLVEALDHVGP